MAASYTGSGVLAQGTYLGQIDVPAATFILTDNEVISGTPYTFQTNGFAALQNADGTLAWSGQTDPAQLGVNTGSCSPPASGVVSLSNPNGRVWHYLPGWLTKGADPTHVTYSTFVQYPTVNDFRVFIAGNGTFPITCTASATLCGTGFPGGSTPGGVVSGSLSLLYMQNTVLSPGSGGALDFNNLPTFSVVSTSGGCGTSGYTFGITDGVLPTGMSLNTSTGALTGAPTVSGPYAFSVYAEKKSISTYCWGKVDFSGVVIIGSGGLAFAGTSNGPLYINSIPQWQIHRFDLRQRPEQKS